MVLAGAAIVLLGFAAAPLAALLVELKDVSLGTLGILGRTRPWFLLLRSVGLALATTAGALVIGLPMGLLIARSNLSARRLLWLLHALPLFLPPILLALGWSFLLGRTAHPGSELTADLLYSDAGVIGSLTLTLAPIASSLVALALLGIDASYEEAARVVARPARVARHILLPAIRPAIVFAAVIVFALSFGELAVPMFLRVDVYPAAVFSRLGGVSYAPAEAFVLAIPMLVVALALLAVERSQNDSRVFAARGLRGMSRAPFRLGRARGWMTFGAWGIAFLGLLPLGVLAVRAAPAIPSLPQWIGASLWTSLITAAISATIITGIAVVIGHGLARNARGAPILDSLALMAFIVPAAVLGIGLIAVWSGSSTRAIYDSIFILVIGFVARYSFIGIRAIAVTTMQSPVHGEEAAAASGAGYGRRLLRIVLPANARGVAAAWVLAAVFCLRDVETAILYYPPDGATLPVRIFTLEANGPPSVVAALATTHVLLTAVLLAFGLLLLRRGQAR